MEMEDVDGSSLTADSQPSWLAWYECWQPPDDESAFTKSTG